MPSRDRRAAKCKQSEAMPHGQAPRRVERVEMKKEVAEKPKKAKKEKVDSDGLYVVRSKESYRNNRGRG